MQKPLALFVGTLLASLVPAQFGDAWVEPKEQYDIEVAQTRLSDNVYIENNTRLFLSTQISTLEEEPKILQPHVGLEVRDAVPIIGDANLVGPQGSLLSGGWSTVVRYDQPRGKNSVASVITAGVRGDFSGLTPEEVRLHNLLLGRFLFDQFLVPGLNWLCGVKLDAATAAGVISGIITGHNSQIIEQFRDVVRTGSPSEAVYFMWQIMVREIETGGPIASYIARKYGVNLVEKMAERIAKHVVVSFIPGLNAVDRMLWLLNSGGTTANMVPAVLDVQSTPTKINFNIYFNAGVGAVYPGFIRMDGADDEISLHGHRLVPVPGKPFLVRVYDKATGKFHEVQNPRVTTSGRSLTFKLPESAIGTRRGPLRFDLVIDKQVLHCPGTVQIVHDLVVHRLEPSHGPPGTRVRIISDGVYPYTRTNTVFMKLPGDLTATRSPVELVSREWLEFVVPPSLLVDTKTNYEVYVEERHGSTRKESRHLTFTVDPGTYEQARQNHREESMPEGKFSVKGTLDDATPARTHLFDAPAGMQIEVELKSVMGPNQSQTVGELEYWNVSLISSPAGAPLQGFAVGDPFQNVLSGLPSQRTFHTTQSIPGQNKYGISVRKKSKEAVSYLFDVRFIRRDDALSGQDAGHDFDHALPIRNNERYNSRLSTERRRHGEDINDIYRVEGVADDNEIVVKVSGAPTTYPFTKDEGTITGVTLYCQGEADREPYPVAWHETPLGARQTTASFVHSTNGNRRYFIEVEGGVANTEYWVEVLVRPAIPPPVPLEPIMSDFMSSDEGWQLSGNFETRTRKPEHQKFEGGGYIHESDALPEQTVGPLDVMIAVDTTGSMGGTIASVRDSTVRIIEELRRRTSTLRVGLVSFKDVASDGAGSRSIVPLSPNIEQSLAAVRGWSASGGGGDGPEDLLHALKGALQSTWRVNDDQGRKVARVVICVTDVPPKVNANGADFEGNTLTSIGRLANAQGARIYPVIVSSDVNALNAAEDLASTTGGKTLQLKSQAEVADALVQSCYAALEPSSPMYWEAPAKFLGDKRRYLGSNLSFLAYSFMLDYTATPEPFSGDDVVLEGAGMAIAMRSGIRPHSEAGSPASWRAYVVPLDPRGKWTHVSTRKLATAEEIGDVLAKLTKLKIRADYYAGQERVQLDEVRMGERDALTDRGLDERGQELLSIFDRWKSMSISTSKQIENQWNTAEADERMEKRFVDRLGRTAGLIYVLRFSGDIELAWTAYSNPGAKERGFSEVERHLNRAVEKLRLKGTATVAQVSRARRAFASWRKFATSVSGQLENLTRMALDIAAGEERLMNLSGTAYGTQADANEALRTRFENAKKGLHMEADAMLTELTELD